MLKTDEQRRWWFANHPEYSSSRKRKKGDKDEVEKVASRQKVRPEDVDAYVDNALKYVDEAAADLLKSFKEQFGTEAAAKTTDQSAAYRATAQQQPINDTMDGPVQRAAEEPEEPAPEGNAAKKPQAGQANTGSGWDNPAHAGGRNSSKPTVWETISQALNDAYQAAQERLRDLDQARTPVMGDFKPLLPGQFKPPKKPSYSDVVEFVKRIRRSIPLLVDPKETESADKAEKAFKKVAKTLDRVQQVKDTLKKVSRKKKSDDEGFVVLAGKDIRHQNAAIAERHGFQELLNEGHIPIKAPGKVTEAGPDYLTYNPGDGAIYIGEAKYRGPKGRYPPEPVPPDKVVEWIPHIRKAITEMPPSQYADEIERAFRKRRFEVRFYKHPPQKKGNK